MASLKARTGAAAARGTARGPRAGAPLGASRRERDRPRAPRADRAAERSTRSSRSLLSDPRPAVRIAALEAAERDGLVELAPQVERADGGRRTRASSLAARTLPRPARRARGPRDGPGPDRGARPLARRPRTRVLAAMAIGRGTGASADRLSVLLWDREASVRQAALDAAGRLGNAEFRPLLVGQLAVPAFAPVAVVRAREDRPAGPRRDRPRVRAGRPRSDRPLPEPRDLRGHRRRRGERPARRRSSVSPTGA